MYVLSSKWLLFSLRVIPFLGVLVCFVFLRKEFTQIKMSEIIYVVFAVASVLFALAVTGTLGYMSGAIRKLEENQTVDMENPPSLDGSAEGYTPQQQMFSNIFPGQTLDVPLTQFPKPESHKKSGSIDTVTGPRLFY